MGRPQGGTTDQPPQEYDLQPQEYPHQVNDNSYYVASSAVNDPNAQLQSRQPQFRPVPQPQPAANQPYPPPGLPVQYPPKQNLQSNPLYQPPQVQNNVPPHQQYQHEQPPAVRTESSPLQPQMYDNQQQPGVAAYPPAPQFYNNVQMPFAKQGLVDGGATNHHQGQGSPFRPQMGYNNANIPGSPMAQANMAAAAWVSVQPQLRTYNGVWRTGLFNCMDDPMNALITLFLPCVTFGQVAEIVDNGQTSCSSSGSMYCVRVIGAIFGLTCLITTGNRTKLRGRFGLMESPGPDWMVHFLCDCCALCQEYRELKLRGWDPAIGWQGNVRRRNMQQAQVQMTPPMHQSMMG